jgi:WD40 repeat protein
LVDFDPTASRIVTLDRQGRAEIVDVERERPVAELAGQLQDINDVAFSPDGALVATAGSDGAVRLFDAATGSQRLALPRQSCGVTDVSFSPDGTKLVSASECEGVRIWALDIDDLLQIARQNVTRPLTDEECRQYLHEDRCPPA